MQITLKLFASLTQHLPNGSQGNQTDLALAEDESVQDIIERLALPSQLVHLVLLNGVYVPPEQRGTQRPKAGDQLAIWPPVAGG